MARVEGEISEQHFVSVIGRIEWTLHDVQSILKKDGDSCCSRSFRFCSGDWTLKMVRFIETTKIQCLGVHVSRISNSSHKNHLDYVLIKIDIAGREHEVLWDKYEVDESIWRRWSEFNLPVHDFSWSEDPAFRLKLVCNLECFECKSGELDRIPRLREIHTSIMRGEGRDMLVNVKGTLIHVRTEALIDRSPVFKVMFSHDMVEKDTGRVTIDTCEPEDFYILRDYFYFDELNINSMDTAYRLYIFIHMYNVSGAKAECVKYMLENLKLESFMRIVELSLLYEDSELREGTYPFFVANSEAIRRTRQWRAFRRLNSDIANEFLTRVGS